MRLSISSVRQKMGCWLNERWRTELLLTVPAIAEIFGKDWRDVANRQERLELGVVKGGRVCAWKEGSDLTVTRLFPEVGTRLMQHVLQRWPISFQNPEELRSISETPAVSIIVQVGGLERLPQFELALATARAQQGALVEVVVIEQSAVPQFRSRLPSDVRYVHQPKAADDPFNRSRALNLGARIAKAEVLVLTDADYLLPTTFAKECFEALQSVEAVRPARLIFHLTDAATKLAHTTRKIPSMPVEAVITNNPTPLAVRAETYFRIGGHDERYSGWGGEDSEFLDRLRTCQMDEGGWMPLLHAWHPPAPQKISGHRNRELHEQVMTVDAMERIRHLVNARRHMPMDEMLQRKSDELSEHVPEDHA